ncbi:MAG: hypothetical protein HYS17_03605 [Micavibrio aeruginosavorus]|uniref:MHYT domain-containing protein n=1 Tax=Micavibrio aeruginosavorus TaxID=349221 RepID=A0A7T5R3L0_9BACT|nr:MAG: hypothetical protein HYS17_03605 [Micavibrio aeruginosavorus]
MLSCEMDMAISYDAGLIALSFVIAIIAACGAI